MQKKTKIRLIGKPLAKLNNDIHERDGHTCIISGCGRYVLPGAKFHHEPCGNTKEDRIERGCLVCDIHHDIRHHGRVGLEDIRRQCVEYLSSIYPEDWTELINKYRAGDICDI